MKQLRKIYIMLVISFGILLVFLDSSLNNLSIINLFISQLLFILYLSLNSNNLSVFKKYFDIVLGIKYFLIPILFILEGKNINLSFVGGYIYFSEILTIILVQSIYNKFSNKNCSTMLKFENKFGIKLIKILILILFVIIVLNKNIIYQEFTFLFNLSKMIDREKTVIEKSNIIIFLFFFLRILLTGIITQICYKKYIQSKKNMYKNLNILFLLVNMLYINGYSRQSMLIQLFILITIIQLIYKDKKLFNKIVTLGTILILYYTFMKMMNGDEGYFDYFNRFILTLNKSLNFYFSGIENFLKAEELKNLMKHISSFDIFFNDSLHSFPGLAKKSELTSTSLYYFNYIINGTYKYQDKITPLSIQAYLYFGTVCSPILIGIYMSLFLYLDNILQKTKNIYILISISYLIFPLSIFEMTNHIIVFGGIMNKIIYFLIIILIFSIERILLKEKKRKRYEKNNNMYGLSRNRIQLNNRLFKRI